MCTFVPQVRAECFQATVSAVVACCGWGDGSGDSQVGPWKAFLTGGSAIGAGAAAFPRVRRIRDRAHSNARLGLNAGRLPQ